MVPEVYFKMWLTFRVTLQLSTDDLLYGTSGAYWQKPLRGLHRLQVTGLLALARYLRDGARMAPQMAMLLGQTTSVCTPTAATAVDSLGFPVSKVTSST